MYNSQYTGEQVEKALGAVISHNSVPQAWGGVVDVSGFVQDDTSCLQYAMVAGWDAEYGVCTIRLRMADNTVSRTYGVKAGDVTVLHAGSFWTSYTYECDIYITVAAVFDNGQFTLQADTTYQIVDETA